MTIVGRYDAAGVLSRNDAAGVLGHNLSIKMTGKEVTIADSDVAHLMYYMDCVGVCLRGFDLPESLTDHRHYFRLSGDEVWRLVLMAQILDPEVLIAVGAFIRDNDVTIFDNSQNEFFEVTDTRYGALVTRDFAVAGVAVHCAKRMVCCDRWIERHFTIPMRNLGNWDGKYVYRTRVFSRGKRCEVQ